jgi:hypothetical protein
MIHDGNILSGIKKNSLAIREEVIVAGIKI